MLDVVDNVRVYDGVAYFKDWLKANGYCSRDEFICDAVSEGKTEAEYEAEWVSLVSEFYDWCNENELSGETV